MSTQNSKSGRRSGRGSRRPQYRDRDNDRDRDRDEPRATAAPKAPAKQSLWQKIVSFFQPAKKQTSSSSRPAQNGPTTATTTSNYPASAPAPRPVRKPEAIEVTSPKVYVGNLSFDATEADLSELFKGVGAVTLAEIVTHSQTQKSKGFGFVTLGSVDEARRAVGELHDKEFMGRKLVVSGAKTPADRR